MSTAILEYSKLTEDLTKLKGVSASQMFGKPCLKINGKAFLAQHQEWIVFKLAGAPHEKALAVPKATLWDPSGKGRPMKEWVAVPVGQSKSLKTFAQAALEYVASGENKK